MNAQLETQDREFAYRIYVTDALFCISSQQVMTKRYIDVMMPDRNKISDDRSGDEIAQDTLNKLATLYGKEEHETE